MVFPPPTTSERPPMTTLAARTAAAASEITAEALDYRPAADLVTACVELIWDRYLDRLDIDRVALGLDDEGVIAASRFARSPEFPKALARVATARIKALGIDVRVRAIREHFTVGRGSCSVIEETYTDAELVEALNKARIRTASGAIKWALDTHKTFHDRWA